ncbi:MAG: hypothetical protein M1834_007389 [Cirrosporium novae-zelandiae]|nr:MAG: hypothetical protein M1834_007389 [Cirrosporium novae-zelandiae]
METEHVKIADLQGQIVEAERKLHEDGDRVRQLKYRVGDLDVITPGALNEVIWVSDEVRMAEKCIINTQDRMLDTKDQIINAKDEIARIRRTVVETYIRRVKRNAEIMGKNRALLRLQAEEEEDDDEETLSLLTDRKRKREDDTIAIDDQLGGPHSKQPKFSNELLARTHSHPGRSSATDHHSTKPTEDAISPRALTSSAPLNNSPHG